MTKRTTAADRAMVILAPVDRPRSRLTWLAAIMISGERKLAASDGSLIGTPVMAEDADEAVEMLPLAGCSPAIPGEFLPLSCPSERLSRRWVYGPCDLESVGSNRRPHGCGPFSFAGVDSLLDMAVGGPGSTRE